MKDSLTKSEQRLLLFSVFVLSLCGIIYELVLGSLATYLLGNPVVQYSVTIGFFLSSMGVGSYLSRFFEGDLLHNFIRIEIGLGFIGGLSVFFLSLLFSFSNSYYAVHIFFLIAIGVLVGLEIPLITRILKRYGSLKDILSNVLSLDYIGGLAGSLLFPLILFPILGRLLSCMVTGIVNIGVALLILLKLQSRRNKALDMLVPLIFLSILIVLSAKSESMNALIQGRFFEDDIVFSRRSKYQEIVLTRSGDDFRLYLDGSIQFSSADEYRYHEMLVFPGLLALSRSNLDVLILGGGDGLALREVLKSASVKSATLVELDPLMIELAKSNSTLRILNKDSLSDKRVRVVIKDAYDYLKKNSKKFDVIIADFPDPHDETIAKLYTTEMYRFIRRSMRHDGIFVTQSASPLFARETFWCIHNTLKKVFPNVLPYHIFIPSFGDWGFNIASMIPIKTDIHGEGIKELRYFSDKAFQNALFFSSDMDITVTKINTFNKPVLYNYYIKGWKNSEDY